MGLPVRIDSDLYDQAKSHAHAHAERRTISGQIEIIHLVFYILQTTILLN